MCRCRVMFRYCNCGWNSPDVVAFALRASDQMPRKLIVEIDCATKPPFESVFVVALQVVDDHGAIRWCPGRGSNPYSQRPRDFKSLVSTNFTTRATLRLYRSADTKKGKRNTLSLFDWSGRRVSNSRPQPWQGCALPTELLPQILGGASRSRTDLHGFAIRCITALLSRLTLTTKKGKLRFP